MHWIARLWGRRELIQSLVARDLKLKYRGTFAGYLWSLLEPLALAATYWFVFVVIAQRGGPLYSLEAVLGILLYSFMSAVIHAGANALVSNAGLIRRVYLPREVFVVSGLGSNLVVLMLSLLVAVPFMLIFKVVPGWRLLLLPLPILLLGAFATGIGFVAACAQAVYRDVGYVLRVLLRIGFYASPVIYSLDWVPERLVRIYLWNPVSVYVTMARRALLNRPLDFPLPQLLSALLVSVLMLLVGGLVFRRWERQAVKHL